MLCQPVKSWGSSGAHPEWINPIPKSFCPPTTVLVCSQLLLGCSAHEALLPCLFSSIEAQLGPGLWPSEYLTTFHSPDLSQHCFSPQLPWLTASHPAGPGAAHRDPRKALGISLGAAALCLKFCSQKNPWTNQAGIQWDPQGLFAFFYLSFQTQCTGGCRECITWSTDLQLQGAASLPGLKEHKRCHSQEGNRKTAAAWKHIFLSCLEGSLRCGFFALC